MDFVIGGLAGAGATIFTNPIDVVKTRMQLQGELCKLSEAKRKYRGILHAMYVIFRVDGPLALQKGLAPAMVFGFAMNSCRLGIYRVAEINGLTKTAAGDVDVIKSVFWSATSGTLSGVIANPLSVVKTRIQSEAHPSIAVGKQHNYKGTLDAFTTIYKAEGFRGYFAGVSAACCRLAIGSGSQLTTFSLAKETLVNYGICESSPFALAFVASMMSGVVVAVAICPLDVCSVRLFNQGTKGKVLYTGIFDCFYKIFKMEGIGGLYKGLGPLYMRLAPHTTLSLVIWDVLNNLLKNKSKS